MTQSLKERLLATDYLPPISEHPVYVNPYGPEAVREIERLKAERDAALREMSEYARQAGEAKGRLEMSEAAGIVDGWRKRAEAAERKLDVMTARADAYEAVLKHIAEGTVPPEPHGHYLAHRDAVRHARTVLRSTDQNDD